MLELQNISFAYEKGKNVLENLSLTLKHGEILAVMGASGCGKSTLLHIVAGLLKPTDGKIISNAKKIAYVFQEPRLFPWLTVEENIAAIAGRETDGQKIRQILSEMELSDVLHQYPAELSGGMKSRVSLARALAYEGDLYLLDEPFAALDEALRQRLSGLLQKRIRQSGASAILVTHQSADAQALADRTVTLFPPAISQKV